MHDTKSAAWIDAETRRAIERMGNRGHDLRIQKPLRDAVERAYIAGRADAWNEVHPIGEVADMLGVTTANIRQLAKKHGIGEKFGRDWMFRDSDVQALQALPKRRRVARDAPKS